MNEERGISTPIIPSRVVDLGEVRIGHRVGTVLLRAGRYYETERTGGVVGRETDPHTCEEFVTVEFHVEERGKERLIRESHAPNTRVIDKGRDFRITTSDDLRRGSLTSFFKPRS